MFVMFQTPIKVHIEDVAVNENHQRKGYGSRVIKNFIEMTREKECYKVNESILVLKIR